MRHVAALLIAVLSISCAAARATERAPIDCPLRKASYSIDSPFLDVLLSDDARHTVDRVLPGFLQHLPAMLKSTTVPSFAAIVTLRQLATFEGVSAERLRPLNHALDALPVSFADSEARCARYDNDRPRLVIPKTGLRLLLFQKITGFRDDASVAAAEAAIRAMAQRNGWGLVVTDKGGAITPTILKSFNAVIWNNVSGDVLTLRERAALKNYIESGGGWVGLHGSGGDPAYFWPWYADTLIGARFLGHPDHPQFQNAKIVIEDKHSGITKGLPPSWMMKDEWYSFRNNPRANGAHVIAKLDESSYSPKGMHNMDLRMGDHPIAWTKCIGDGRAFYSAIGHRPVIYSEEHYVRLLEQAIIWSSSNGVCGSD